MKQNALGTLAGLALIGAGFLFYNTLSRQDEGVTLQDGNPEVVALGSSLYVKNCAACHGVNLEGEPDWQSRDAEGRLRAPPHDASGHTWHHDSALLFQLTKFGPAKVIGDPDYTSNMPAYQGVLSDEEIVAVLSYIKSTWPKHIRARHDEMETRR